MVMDNNYWQQKWQDNDIGFNQSKPNPLMKRYFDSLHLKQDSLIFVPLCGKSIDMLWLAEQGYRVIGVELSTIACAAFFEEHHISVTVTQSEYFTHYHSDKITLLSGDFFNLNPMILGDIDAVFDRAALVALPQSLRWRYVSFLNTLLQSKTSILLVSFTYDQSVMQGPPFSVDQNEVTALYSADYTIQLLFDEPVQIRSHLQVKGLTSASEQAYCLLSKRQTEN
jgi:thiopurine S-methyltransferase